MKEALDIAKEGIESLDKDLDVHQMADKVVSWSKLNNIISQLGNHRLDFSKEAATLLSQIETKMLDVTDAYIRATQNIVQWSGLAVELLEPYKSFFDGEMDRDLYNTQRDILLQLLDDGITKINNGHEEIAAVSSSFMRLKN